MAAPDLRSPQPLRADFTHPNPSVVSAYTTCRAAEHVAVSDPIQDSDHWPPPDDRTVKTKLVNIRILGHLLAQTRLLSDTAIATVATGIRSCERDTISTGSDEVDVEALSALGEVYRNHLLHPFRKFKGPTPSTSSHPSPSPPSCKFKLTDEEIDQLLAETPRSPSKSRQLALHRDDFRCIVTRVLDISYARELQAQTPGHGPLEAQALECCHILPASESTSYEFQGVLRSLGYTTIADELATAGQVRSLENTMTMVHVLHDHFARLDLWFEPVEDSHSEQTSNRYRLRTLWLLPHGLADGQPVTFCSAHSRLPPPSPAYLRLHAACCRVAHLSGAARLFDELERDLEADPDPEPAAEGPAFARALRAHLDCLSLSGTAVEES